MTETLSRIAGSGITHVVFAFTAMGGWAVFANSGHPMPKPLIAGLVQGTLSACITLVLKTTIEWLAARFSGLAALIVPPLVAFSISLCILTAIHALNSTPEIIRTISLPLTVATTYAAIYNYSLWKRANHS